MPRMSQQIYHQLDGLFPGLRQYEPHKRIDCGVMGMPGINIIVLESAANRIYFVLCRYQIERGCVVANPSFEITANLKRKTADVITYMDDRYFHKAVHGATETGSMPQAQANRFLYDFLSGLQATRQSAHGGA
jgi:hypothetical protein